MLVVTEGNVSPRAMYSMTIVRLDWRVLGRGKSCSFRDYVSLLRSNLAWTSKSSDLGYSKFHFSITSKYQRVIYIRDHRGLLTKDVEARR